MGWDDESRNDVRHPIRTLAQSLFLPAAPPRQVLLCLRHILKICRISNALFSFRIIILSRKPITSHS
ncbi:hypothetical protein At1D1460_26420 [Agrobacterium tumefaciens]|jgi:hypothetical protein|nr:hypothetical protein At1D1460_26420 [Agrobacterium tumefaciens]KWT88651.1 hypothetical protein ASB65_00525 [Agrobacterium tumefaciens str. B6]MQB23553.1 hypothetical protein [Agrobacterium tumefaciens]OCJ40701.1 hypothetical protein A6U90_00520 [Agrobacterium tumefaciens]SPZ37203.1 Uncharacterised protein [Agrobacterium tumefaciens]